MASTILYNIFNRKGCVSGNFFGCTIEIAGVELKWRLNWRGWLQTSRSQFPSFNVDKKSRFYLIYERRISLQIDLLNLKIPQFFAGFHNSFQKQNVTIVFVTNWRLFRISSQGYPESRQFSDLVWLFITKIIAIEVKIKS